MRSKLHLAVFAMALNAACILDNPEAPEIAGPSTQGRSVEVRALPDQLTADGWSSSVIEAVLRGPNSERLPGATIHFDISGFVDLGNLAPLNGPRPTYGGVEATAVAATTDGDGVARARYWAPFRTDQPSDTIVTILAREGGTNFREAFSSAGEADIFLRAADRPIPGPIPIPQPGCEDATAEIELSRVCDGGEILAGRSILGVGAASEGGAGQVITTYIWDWGDGSGEVTGSSSASHTYGGGLVGLNITVSLTVVNSCGASASASVNATVVAACP
ncbi:MAG: PKD domain-containing protein [Vicinamibacteria bacterium]